MLQNVYQLALVRPQSGENRLSLGHGNELVNGPQPCVILYLYRVNPV